MTHFRFESGEEFMLTDSEAQDVCVELTRRLLVYEAAFRRMAEKATGGDGAFIDAFQDDDVEGSFIVIRNDDGRWIAEEVAEGSEVYDA
ncbi:MAG: hypothetical protein MJ058_04180 [Akkermansia sp.]|nr:hypothetical protein [Akkermansia sp.]